MSSTQATQPQTPTQETTQPEEALFREQYESTIRAYAAFPRDPSSTDKAAEKRIHELLDNKETIGKLKWTELYGLELLLSQVMEESICRRELTRRVAEATERIGGDYAAQYSKIDADTEIKQVRAALHRLVNDLLWRDTKEQVNRQLFSRSTRYSSRAFSVCTVLFLIIAGGLFAFGGCGALGGFLLPSLLFLAAASGAWGATFSMLMATRQEPQLANLGWLLVFTDHKKTIARTLVGAGCGIIFFLAIVSGFLSGSAFPKGKVILHCTTSAVSAETNPKDKGDKNDPQGQTSEKPTSNDDLREALALLAIWCVIAGFSERFIIGMLDRAANSSTGGGSSQAPSPGSLSSGGGQNPPSSQSSASTGATASQATSSSAPSKAAAATPAAGAPSAASGDSPKG